MGLRQRAFHGSILSTPAASGLNATAEWQSWARPGAERLLRRQRSPFGGLLFASYRWRLLRPAIRAMLERMEGGIMFSETLRRICKHYYSVTLGAFTYGPGLKPSLLWPGTRIGNFSSIAGGVKVLRRNHPTNWASQHPLFFNHIVGLLQADSIPAIPENPLIIGSDVWIGLDVIVCPGCRMIGDGAIIGAGAILSRDVPPFTIVAGNPARPIRKRFSPEVEAVVAASEWWLRPLPELVEHLDLFTQEITEENLSRFAAAFPPRPKVSRQ